MTCVRENTQDAGSHELSSVVLQKTPNYDQYHEVLNIVPIDEDLEHLRETIRKAVAEAFSFLIPSDTKTDDDNLSVFEDYEDNTYLNSKYSDEIFHDYYYPIYNRFHQEFFYATELMKGSDEDHGLMYGNHKFNDTFDKLYREFYQFYRDVFEGPQNDYTYKFQDRMYEMFYDDFYNTFFDEYYDN